MANDGDYNLPLLSIYGAAVVAYPQYILPSLQIAGEATCPIVCTGNFVLKHLEVSGYTGEAGDYHLPALIIAGTALNQAPAAGSYRLPMVLVSGEALSDYVGTGAYALPSLTMSGAAVVGGTATGNVILPALGIKGAAHIAPAVDNYGDFDLPALTFSGYAENSSSPYIIKHRRDP